MLFCSYRISLDWPSRHGKWIRNKRPLRILSHSSCFNASFDEPNSRWAVHLRIWEVRFRLFIPGAPIHAKNLFCAQCPPVNAQSSRSALTELRIDTIDIVKGLPKSNFFLNDIMRITSGRCSLSTGSCWLIFIIYFIERYQSFLFYCPFLKSQQLLSGTRYLEWAYLRLQFWYICSF